jgi:hypothetical protein
VLAIFIYRKGNRMLDKLIALFRQNKPVKKSPLIQERLMKIMWNPYNEKYYWCIFNPNTRTWEWNREALPFEVDTWKGETVAEWKGDNING